MPYRRCPRAEQVTDSLTVTSLDGTASETITVTVTGAGQPDQPAFSVSGTVVDREGDELAGVTVSYTPEGEGGIIAVGPDAARQFSLVLPLDAEGQFEAARA